ncbi:sensor histidine kinase [Qipengyuania sp.]|uniref:sensor histidine kinase n=1 Tax=Qipengyuania sp. TaxID=2004515 RepID=UPI0035C7EA2A
MHFDDRLATVLQHRASGARAARVQFRQLIDLLGEPTGITDPVLDRAAYRRLDALARLLPIADRARIVAEVGARIRTSKLLAFLAQADAEIALAALARATLSEAQWQALIPELPIRARGLLRHRRSLPPLAISLLDRLGVQDRVLPEPAFPQVDPVEVRSSSSEEPEDSDFKSVFDWIESAEQTMDELRQNDNSSAGELAALIGRIEAFQRAREHRASTDSPDSPRLPLGEDHEDEPAADLPPAFVFTADAAGRIDWAEGRYAPLLTGAPLAPRTPAHLPPADPLGAALRFRRPVEGATVEWSGPAAISGTWIVDVAPRLDPAAGQFTGFIGRCRRPATSEPNLRARKTAEKIHQLLHELRNPITAIQGFAEVIQQQTVGPVPHAYRAHAASIAHESARLLAAFEEIERLAHIEAGTMDDVSGQCDFALIVRRQVAQLSTNLSPRVARMDLDCRVADSLVPLTADNAEHVAWRILGTVAAAMGGGETIATTLDRKDHTLRLTVVLPAALARSADVFSGEARSAPSQLDTGLLGSGFTLRLARAEARAAGGDLTRETSGGVDHLLLCLPMDDATDQPDSDRVGAAERLHHRT